MIYSSPGATEYLYADQLPTGLAGTLQVELLEVDGDVAIAPTVSGIVEVATGRYRATITSPQTAGDYLPRWINGTDTYDDFEVLRVAAARTLASGAYADVVDVLALDSARGTYTASSVPTVDQVQSFLVDGAAIIDTTLAGRGFDLPVAATATTALAALRVYNAEYAWARVERSAVNSPHRDAAEKAWQASQKMLASMVEPPGMVRDTGTSFARTSGDETASAAFSYTMEL